MYRRHQNYKFNVFLSINFATVGKCSSRLYTILQWCYFLLAEKRKKRKMCFVTHHTRWRPVYLRIVQVCRPIWLLHMFICVYTIVGRLVVDQSCQVNMISSCISCIKHVHLVNIVYNHHKILYVVIHRVALQYTNHFHNWLKNCVRNTL